MNEFLPAKYSSSILYHKIPSNASEIYIGAGRNKDF